eukprot:EG_transcript_12061
MGAAVNDVAPPPAGVTRRPKADSPSDGDTPAPAPRTLLQYRFQPVGLLLSLPFWPAIIALPLFFAYEDRYRTWIPAHLHEAVWPGWPAPLGLCLGLISVAIGQVAVVLYHVLHIRGFFGTTMPIQSEGARPSVFLDALRNHLSQPEGFAIVGSWLILTWMLNILPQSYYSFEGGIEWGKVAGGLLLQDGLQWVMHYAEHKVSAKLYQLSHKPHHRFVNPIMFDAFDGSLLDTLLMILLPLTIVTQLVYCNVWTYMTIGSLYSGWLTLIHSEYVHPWEGAFRCIGFGTAADHHVHHKVFVYNYGHLFLYWDRVAGTYKSPADVRTFNKNV